MPTFQAINLESEENAEEQVDTAKELHVYEALKRFQNALKLHAQGPRAREAAAAAYEDLLDSDIFRYREAKTDYERAERQADGRYETSALESFSAGLDVDATGPGGVAASLSQALYLSYKNYGQFYLDRLKDDLRASQQDGRKVQVRPDDERVQKVIQNWTAALDQDPSDPELWRKAARFASSMDSGRVKRYCLEAAVELDDDPAVVDFDPPSLSEAFAGEQLKEYLELLGDKLALTHPIMTPWHRRQIPILTKPYLDPLPFLPDPAATLTPLSSSPARDSETLALRTARFQEEDAQDFGDPELTWPGLGSELTKYLHDKSGALRVCRNFLEALRSGQQFASESAKGGRKSSLGGSALDGSHGRADGRRRGKAELKGRRGSGTSDAATKSTEQARREREGQAPTRKRSQSAAGIPEGADEENATEKRSKRVRRRTDAMHFEEAADQETLIASQMLPYQEADLHLFQTTQKLLKKIGYRDGDDDDALNRLQGLSDSCYSEDRICLIRQQAAIDLHSVLSSFHEDLATILLSKKEQAPLCLSSFLEHTKPGPQDGSNVPKFDERQGLQSFLEQVNGREDWITSEDICFEWVKAVSESYATTQWSEAMKNSVTLMLRRADGILYRRLETEAETPKPSLPESMIPMLFELHMEMYERMTSPAGAVDDVSPLEAKYRLDRWLSAASAYASCFPDRPSRDPFCVRFLWGAVMTASMAESPDRDHILLLWTSLRDFLVKENVPEISLPNSLVMPVISTAAADREISKLTTMDFFLGLFQEEMEDPVQVIDTLEPVLNPSSVIVEAANTDDLDVPESSSSPPPSGKSAGKLISECASQEMRDLWNFLQNSSTELRLFLWSRLGDAYADINYTTKQFSCLLKGIEMVVSDLGAESYSRMADEPRRLLFVRLLKSLDELLIQSLTLALNDEDAFDIIDEGHIKSSSSALAKLSCILHVASLCEDRNRIGAASAAPTNNSTFISLVTRLREMQVRTWCLQYTILKAGFVQRKGIKEAEKDLIEFLAAVHRAFGLRRFCKSSNKIFLKMMRMELLGSKNMDLWENPLGQVLYDLHGLKIGVGTWEAQDHGCPYEKLEKKQAMQLVEKVMMLASRLPMKELLKSDLKTAIEHIQQAIGQTKSNPQMIHNLRNFTEVLKKPIHPLRLYQALSGDVSVDAVSTNNPEAALARNGWFFLLGMIALTKFKGVDLNRRQTPGATDDLRIGATFLRLQLQFTADKWDAWFRLGECFDYELDESVLWTADKINKDRTELVKFQRSAIHCYTLALSHSRHLDLEVKEADALHDLYHKFAMRLYSSSREPFAMEPFQHSDQERFFIENMGAGTFKKILHEQMSDYKVWKFSAKLFRMAMKRKPGNWKNPYMLAKCLWKMYQTPSEQLDGTDRMVAVTPKNVLDALRNSIQVATTARKSRHSDPILEPHYKLVSILHKLVISGDMAAAEAASLLSEQPFGVSISPGDHYASFSEPEDWEEYIIRNLSKLRDKDKSNWHHRIVMRHAKILFDEASMALDDEGYVEAKAAFGVLKENMFTKTMVMNVWKCDAERPGRHHVFTEQYVRFMTKLLLIMADRTNLELLLRRLRKKGADFYHFTDLWQSCCMAYLKLLRAAHDVGPSAEDAFKALSAEDFDAVGERITEWAASEGSNNAALSCMKDAVELKKLNANLMKVAPIDDLINDCYTKIYLGLMDSFIDSEPIREVEEQKAATEGSPAPDAAAEADMNPGGLTVGSSSLSAPKEQQHDGPHGASTPGEAEKSETAPKTRKPVRRPDILRKAEQAVLRSLEVPKSAGSKGSLGNGGSGGKRGSQTPAVVLSDVASFEEEDEGPEAPTEREAGEDADEELREADVMDEVGDEEANEAQESKEPYAESVSLQDSADDSDLSDVPEGYDEEIPPGLLFSNLEGAGEGIEASGEEADGEDDGNEVDAEEGEDDLDIDQDEQGDGVIGNAEDEGIDHSHGRENDEIEVGIPATEVTEREP